jgi:putative FmdB family regulatory protein
MPNYDYRCSNCGQHATIYQTYEEYGDVPVTCPECGSEQMARIIGRVRFARSEESRLDDLADPSQWAGLDEEDPRALAKMMRTMGKEMGEELPPEFDEVVGRLEAGESPESIEESMPDLDMPGGDDWSD